MWFTKEERIGLLIVGLSMLLGSTILNIKDKRAVANLSRENVFAEESTDSAKFIPQVSNRVNVNTASFEELVSVPGIGPKTAEAIIRRRENKKFSRIEELLEVKGIGKKKLEEIRKYVDVK